MRTDGTGERLLTENYYQEAPSWSPNGRVLVFYRETKAGEKEKAFQLNYGQLILQAIMREDFPLKPMLQTHLGPLYYLSKVKIYVK